MCSRDCGGKTREKEAFSSVLVRRRADMPFYHKKVGKYGRASIRQVTTAWRKELHATWDDKAERRRVYKERKAAEKAAALEEHRAQNADQKRGFEELQALEKQRRDATKKIQDNNFQACAVRTERSLMWWRQNAEREQAEADAEADRRRLEEERKAKELTREHAERWGMAAAEEERILFLSEDRSTFEQEEMRRFGTIEAHYTNFKKVDTVTLHSKAAQDMRNLELHILQQKVTELHEASDEESEEERTLALEEGVGGEKPLVVQEEEEDMKDMEEELNFVEDGTQYTISHELQRYPDATSIKCHKFGVVGAKLLARSVCPPTPQLGGLGAPGGGDVDLTSACCPVLLELNMSYNNIGNKGMQALNKAFRWGAVPQLRTLLLDSNRIADAGLSGFVEALNHGGVHKLQRISFRTNAISDYSALQLGHSLLHGTLPGLLRLDLKSNRVRVKTARVMLSFAASTAAHPKLECINLSANFVDRRQLRRFCNGVVAPAVCF